MTFEIVNDQVRNLSLIDWNLWGCLQEKWKSSYISAETVMDVIESVFSPESFKTLSKVHDIL